MTEKRLGAKPPMSPFEAVEEEERHDSDREEILSEQSDLRDELRDDLEGEHFD